MRTQQHALRDFIRATVREQPIPPRHVALASTLNIFFRHPISWLTTVMGLLFCAIVAWVSPHSNTTSWDIAGNLLLLGLGIILMFALPGAALALWLRLRFGSIVVATVLHSEFTHYLHRSHAQRSFTVTVRFPYHDRLVTRRLTIEAPRDAVPRPTQRLQLLLGPGGSYSPVLIGWDRTQQPSPSPERKRRKNRAP
jgi:hypothetical protein